MKRNNWLRRLLKSKTAMSTGSIVGVVVSVVIVTALIPVIATQVANTSNLSSTEQTILGLSTTFIVLGLVYAIARKSGLARG